MIHRSCNPQSEGLGRRTGASTPGSAIHASPLHHPSHQHLHHSAPSSAVLSAPSLLSGKPASPAAAPSRQPNGSQAPTPKAAPAPGATPQDIQHNESTWAPLHDRTAIVVGAGPAGCTLAMYLARAGWRVRVFEKRPEPGPATTSRQRSWVLTLYPRGIRPVTAVAEVPLLRERAYKGLVILPSKDKAGSKPLVLERCGVLMDRTLVATSLLDAARQQYGSRIEFTFSAPLERVDFARKVAVFAAGPAAATPGTARQEVPYEAPYDLLVGADGANSTLRSLLTAAFPGEYDTEVLSGPSSSSIGVSCYKAVYGLPPVPEAEAWDPDHGAPPGSRLQGEFFFVLSGGQKGFMSMCRDIDGTYCGYMAASEALFEQQKTREDYLALLPQCGPQLPAQWLPLMADRLLAAPASSFPTMRSLSRFWAPGGAVLVGDAAHTVTPALGQGLNSALQDCELLAGELAALGSQWEPGALDAALRRFSETRAPEIRALQELELIQGAGLSSLSWFQDQPLRLAALLARKWVILQYSGVALLGTVAATVLGAAAGKNKKQVPTATPTPVEVGPAAAAAGGDREEGLRAQKEEEQPGSQSMADILATQMDATYVRSPPMYELLRGHMGYREMLVRVYGMAALGTACTAALLGGAGWGAAQLLSAVRAAVAGTP